MCVSILSKWVAQTTWVPCACWIAHPWARILSDLCVLLLVLFPLPFFHQSPFFQIFIFLPGLVTASDIAVLVWFIQILGSFFHFIFLFSYALGWRVCLSDFIWNVFSALDNSFCNFRHTFRYAQFLISMLTLHQSVKLFACIVIPAKTTSPPFCCYLWAGRYQRTCSYMDHTYLFSLYTLLFCGFCKTSCK